jgi:hypothetical protein
MMVKSVGKNANARGGKRQRFDFMRKAYTASRQIFGTIKRGLVIQCSVFSGQISDLDRGSEVP